MSRHDNYGDFRLWQMINAVHLKLCILQSSGEIKELKDCSNGAFVTLKETSL